MLKVFSPFLLFLSAIFQMYDISTPIPTSRLRKVGTVYAYMNMSILFELLFFLPTQEWASVKIPGFSCIEQRLPQLLFFLIILF